MSQLPRYESYKDSGVQWLGVIPSHWNTMAVRRILEEHRQGYYTNEPYIENGVKLARITDIQSTSEMDLDNSPCVENKAELKEFFLQENDFLFARTGGAGSFGIVRQKDLPAVYASYLIRFRFKEAVEAEYLKFFFKSSYFLNSLVANIHGGVNQNIHAEDIKSTFLALPPIEEQKKIANFLNAKIEKVNILIAKQETLLEKLAEQRVALISHAVTKGLNPDVEMKESKIRWVRDIPIHWNVVPVRYLFEFKNNQRIPVSAEDRGKMSEKIYPYYGASGIIDFVEDYIFDEDLLLVAEDGANLLSRSTPLAFKASGKYWVNNHAHIIKPLDNNLTYWEYVLALYDFTPLISGSAQPKLTKDNLASIKLPNPPDEEKRKICNFLNKPLENLKEQKLKIEKILETLKEYRSTLITQVVTGKIDVRNFKVN